MFQVPAIQDENKECDITCLKKSCIVIVISGMGDGGALAQSVERSTPGEEVPRCGHPLPTGWVDVSIM